MFLSRLKLNPRSREVRRDLANPYDMHRTLMRAFPDQQAGGPGRVLWRVDTDRSSGVPTVLVQSERRPEWRFEGEERGSYLGTESHDVDNPAVKEPNLQFSPGQELVFRLRANPTVKRNEKRHGLVREEEQVAWLRRKAESGGFELLSLTVCPEQPSRARKSMAGNVMSFVTVRFDGTLRVVDGTQFLQTVESGIGSAKGFGFGLVSLARPSSCETLQS